MSEPFTADSVEESIARVGTIIVSMFSDEKGPKPMPDHFRAIPRMKRLTAKAKPQEMAASDLISHLGGSHADQ